MDHYHLVRLIHVVSSTLLFGTGLGTAFFMFTASRSRNPQAIAITARNVVLADWLFTAPSVLIQPITGYLLMNMLGYSFDSLWFMCVVFLYLMTGGCWVPVVLIQYRLRAITATCETGGRLSDEFRPLMRLWIGLGVPGFSAVVLLFVLMVYRPWI